jgi:hypothetical protein
MANLRETYDLPKRTPVPVRHWALMVGMVVLALVLWRVLPDGPLTVALLVVLVLGAVFTGVQAVLRSKQLSTPPGRNPTTPPSAGGT